MVKKRIVMLVLERIVMLVLVGILLTMLGAFPAAYLTALVYRFPVPFVGIVSGPFAMKGIMKGIWFAVISYGILGGFVLEAAAGAVGGLFISGLSIERKWSKLKAYTVLAVYCLVFDIIACVVLGSLDLIIGPW